MAVFVRANNVYLVLPIISPFLCVKLISLIRINFVHLNQNSRFFCIKTRFLLLKFSRFKHNSSDSKLLNGTKMKTSMINFNLTFKAWLFSDYLRKVVQMDWKSRLFLKQNNFTPYFSLILEMFETLLRKIVVCVCAFVVCCCCCCCLFVLCRILFSFIHPLEHNWKTYTSLIRKRHWNKFSAKMTSQDYTLRNIFFKKMFVLRLWSI